MLHGGSFCDWGGERGLHVQFHIQAVCVCAQIESAGLRLCEHSVQSVHQTNKNRPALSFFFLFSPAAPNKLSFYLFYILNVQ